MDENEAREAAAMIETAKAQLEALARQQEIIQLTVDEHSRARETIQRMAAGDPGDDVLVPIGADSFIHAKVSDNKAAVVGVGANVSFERTAEEAGKMLDARIDELRRAMHKIGERMEQTESSIQQISDKIQAFYMQQGESQDSEGR